MGAPRPPPWGAPGRPRRSLRTTTCRSLARTSWRSISRPPKASSHRWNSLVSTSVLPRYSPESALRPGMWNTTSSAKQSAIAPTSRATMASTIRRTTASSGSATVSEGDAREDHDPWLGHLLDRVPKPLAAIAGVLGPAVRHLVGPEGRHVVHDDPADSDLPVREHGPVDVAGEHPALEPEGRAVDLVDGLLEGLVPVDRGHRPEDLLPAHLHVLAHAAQDRGQVEGILPLPADKHLGALGQRLVDHPLDLVQPARVDQGPHVGVGVHGVADPEALHLLDQAGDENVVRPRVEEDPLDGDAGLP